jgi:hypothetical protein
MKGLAAREWTRLKTALEQECRDIITSVEVSPNGPTEIKVRNKDTGERLRFEFYEHKLQVQVETSKGPYGYAIESDDMKTVYFIRDKYRLLDAPEPFNRPLRESLRRNIDQIVDETFRYLDPKHGS